MRQNKSLSLFNSSEFFNTVSPTQMFSLAVVFASAIFAKLNRSSELSHFLIFFSVPKTIQNSERVQVAFYAFIVNEFFFSKSDCLSIHPLTCAHPLKEVVKEGEGVFQK